MLAMADTCAKLHGVDEQTLETLKKGDFSSTDPQVHVNLNPNLSTVDVEKMKSDLSCTL